MILSRRLRSTAIPYPTGSAYVENGLTINFSATTAGDIGVLFGSYPSATVPGWTRIETGAIGSLFVKTMTAGETSATFSNNNFLACVGFFRGALLPTTSNSAITSTYPCDPPITPIKPDVEDLVVIAGYYNYSTTSFSASMPDGFTELVYYDNPDVGATRMIGMGYRAPRTVGEDVNPLTFPWGTDSGATCSAITLVLKKS